MTSLPLRTARPALLALVVAVAVGIPAHASDASDAGDLDAAKPELVSPAASVPAAAVAVVRGRLSWYGRKFAGLLTASGQPFDPEAMTMAHRTLPFGTLVRVTNLANRRSAVLRVNDRGPFVKARVADVSAAAARVLHMHGAGVITAELEVLGSNDER